MLDGNTIITFNCGGQGESHTVQTCLETILVYPKSKLCKIVVEQLKDSTSPIFFLDHNATRFLQLIDCLRDGQIPPLEQDWYLRKDLQFFGPFDGLEEGLETQASSSPEPKKAPDFEKDLMGFTGKKRARMELEQNELIDSIDQED